MAQAEFLVVGGGIAGLSAAARLAAQGRVVVLEAEDAVGYHSSGRSATFAHYGIGNRPVRGMTSYSRAVFQAPPEGFADVPLARQTPALFVANEAMLPVLDALEAEMARFTDTIARVDEAEIRALCPVLRFGGEATVAGVVDRGGLRLDSDALLQGYARAVRGAGGEVSTGRRIASVRKAGSDWEVVDGKGDRWSAPVLIDAAGAWADGLAEMAGVRPLGLTPLRRTIIVVDPPEGVDARGWPFVKTAADEFYMLPEGGKLMASPVDEIEDVPGDASPEEYDVALAAHRAEQWTTLEVRRIQHRWAGLRTFSADRVPVAGFAPDAPGFFWLAGQGGFGLQTAPAMALATEALILGREWPAELAALSVERDDITPDRLVSA
ncbi:NAD(P)/FAD-dependent oxidoreductase [Allosphingosinicella indica]|uniref:D-arginine dehydrogenase n=1 Tax=Allosphingosinicella indica TaxID=941907 RepID=A0A1X7G0B3_9SPHN|nr:FAD-binding oxidoreductase [Allosphingosinicella indica]SMF61437.1 D-arginine dehydrogenase [Allosphingosinicella indica]